MIICTHLVAGNLPIKTLVARQWPTSTATVCMIVVCTSLEYQFHKVIIKVLVNIS
jgi:hypothetical protein